MKVFDPTIAPDSPVFACTLRSKAGSPSWLREFDRAQWAALGEHADRSSPTSAAQPRVPDKAEPSSDNLEGAGDPGGDALRKESSEASGDGLDASNMPALAAVLHSANPVLAGHLPLASAKSAAADVPVVELRAPNVASGAGGGAMAPGAVLLSQITLRLEGGDHPAEVPHLHGQLAQLEVEGEAPAAAVNESTEPGTSTTIAARSLRVFRRGDAADVVIRDATFDAANLPALIVRLANQLSAAGSRLATLTLNGQLVYGAASRLATAHDPNADPTEVSHAD